MLTMAHRLATNEHPAVTNTMQRSDELMADYRRHQDVARTSPHVNCDSVEHYMALLMLRGEKREWQMDHDYPTISPPFVNATFGFIPHPDEGAPFIQAGCVYESFAMKRLSQQEQAFVEQSLSVEAGKISHVATIATYFVYGTGPAAGMPVFSGIESVISSDASGRLVSIGNRVSYHDESRDDVSALGEMSGVVANVVCMTISLMHCKNVAKRDVTAEVGPPAKWLRRQKCPKIKCYTLDIEPMKQVLRTEGGIEQNGLKKALHICRGHFATYTDENPLFGRVTGTFWKPQHVRGSKEFGEVKKDYRVKV